MFVVFSGRFPWYGPVVERAQVARMHTHMREADAATEADVRMRRSTSARCSPRKRTPVPLKMSLPAQRLCFVVRMYVCA